jgi:uncharacterized protein (DUF302 family)
MRETFIPEGLTVFASRFGSKETFDRLAAAIVGRGMTILARIDHAAAASQAGMELRPTEVMIFGNPRVGTRLMQAAQTAGIDLPLKAVVWEDENGRTWLAYNDPKWVAKRHRADAGSDEIIGAMSAALAAVATKATSSDERNA